MDKLTRLETIEAERQEKIRAQKKEQEQRTQRLKRLWYLPVILEYVALFIILALFATLCLFTWFILWENKTPTKEIYCMKVKVQKQWVVHCTLPKTGAEI